VRVSVLSPVLLIEFLDTMLLVVGAHTSSCMRRS
jgi:hypothetical protein